MCPKDVDGLANSVDPDHPASEQYDLGLQYDLLKAEKHNK